MGTVTFAKVTVPNEKNSREMFMAIFVIIGALVGAGFASGNEIAVYFLSCGKYFIPAIALSMAVIGILGKMSMDIAFETGIYSYDKFIFPDA